MNLADIQKRVLASGKKFDLLTNLVAYWDMNGNGVDEVASISPILQTNVTFNNASILGTSASVTNTSAVLRYADDDRFSFTTPTNDLPFSISFWVYFTAFSSTGNWLIMKRSISGGYEYQITRDTSTTRLFITKSNLAGNTIFQVCQSKQNLFSLNTWYHVVVTDKGTANFNDINIYINGINESDIKSNIGGTYTKMSNTNQTFAMLNANWSPQTPLSHQGRLDEVAIWKNRELTPQDVMYLYNAGAGRTYPL